MIDTTSGTDTVEEESKTTKTVKRAPLHGNRNTVSFQTGDDGFQVEMGSSTDVDEATSHFRKLRQ